MNVYRILILNVYLQTFPEFLGWILRLLLSQLQMEDMAGVSVQQLFQYNSSWLEYRTALESSLFTSWMNLAMGRARQVHGPPFIRGIHLCPTDDMNLINNGAPPLLEANAYVRLGFELVFN